MCYRDKYRAFGLLIKVLFMCVIVCGVTLLMDILAERLISWFDMIFI